MRCKGWLIASIALNGALAAALVFILQRPAEPPSMPEPPLEFEPAQYRTNVVVRRQNFTWNEVESEDYAGFIQNLRDIGCPERTIRDIIVAEVNLLFLHRRLTEIIPPDHEWWRTQPDPELVESANAQLRELEEERRDLLTQLLGPDWETAGHPLPPEVLTGIRLSGPVLGEIAPDTKDRIYDTVARTQARTRELVETHRREGTQPDAVELARIRQEQREELARLLSPEQMQEFLLRYSHTADQMRQELHGIEFTPEEFRRMFVARDAFDQQVEIHYRGDDPLLTKVRENLEQQRDAAVRNAMGQAFHSVYQLNQDPLYREARSTAEHFGAPPELVLPIYEINQLSEAERERIRNDILLSNEEKIDALAAVHAEQQKSLERLLGSSLLESYLKPQQSP